MTTALSRTVETLVPEITALRRELHEHPEIRFEEKWTSDRIARFLDEQGISYERGFAKGTGIVATITGTGSGAVALRADIDALEIEEQTGLPYASKIENRMHACGHDGHTATLCGAAKTLHLLRDQLQGTVKCIFQPAEEGAAGGRFIVEEGVLDDVQAAFALHAWPTLPVGKVGIREGWAMASAGAFHIEIEGKGCHAAEPAAGVDPIVVAAHIVTALQSIVSREVAPHDAAVVTVGKIQAGHVSNIIPEKAIMIGTVRSFDPAIHKRLEDSIRRIVTNTAAAFRATAIVDFGTAPYPALYNDLAMARFVQETVVETFGRENLADMPYPYMGAEDFAFYLQKVPGAYIHLGINPSETESYPSLHNPQFNFNDNALPTAIELMACVAMRFLER